MTTMRFNRRQIAMGQRMEIPTDDLLKNTLGLVNASVEDAARYGGDVTRAALSAMKFQNNRKYITVDVKVHMLMPGMCPAIPGWHTDGAPRNTDGHPQGAFPPDLKMQEEIDGLGRGTHYHLLTTGEGCLTEFFTARGVELEIPDRPSTDLYQKMSKQVAVFRGEAPGTYTWTTAYFRVSPSCQVVTWDWWNIHRGVVATKKEWRYLIRVTESDFLAPDTDLRKVIRTQQQVYASQAFGW